jgi:hypothetical protein
MTVDVTTPHLFGYIGLLRTLDELAATAEGLVGAGLITPGERTDATRYWRDQVMRTGRDIIRIAEGYRGRCQ